MNKEDKALLLKDLCARLPYGVKCNAFLKQVDGSLKSVFGTFKGYNNWATVGNNLVDIETVRPYLRPMITMTEEERKEYKHLVAFSGSHDGAANFIDWLNANHFDYHGLIEKDLAVAVTEENNPYKN